MNRHLILSLSEYHKSFSKVPLVVIGDSLMLSVMKLITEMCLEPSMQLKNTDALSVRMTIFSWPVCVCIIVYSCKKKSLHGIFRLLSVSILLVSTLFVIQEWKNVNGFSILDTKFATRNRIWFVMDRPNSFLQVWFVFEVYQSINSQSSPPPSPPSPLKKPSVYHFTGWMKFINSSYLFLPMIMVSYRVFFLCLM